jgi:hypothetical protein
MPGLYVCTYVQYIHIYTTTIRCLSAVKLSRDSTSGPPNLVAGTAGTAQAVDDGAEAWLWMVARQKMADSGIAVAEPFCLLETRRAGAVVLKKR